MNFDTAIEAHMAWKIKFRVAMQNRQQLDEATIARDNCCDLGKWLHGEAVFKYAQLSSYAACVQQHAKFHQEAAQVARAINKGEFARAETLLAHNSTYSGASGAVVVALGKLRREVEATA